jgi:hypothetical protein
VKSGERWRWGHIFVERTTVARKEVIHLPPPGRRPHGPEAEHASSPRRRFSEPEASFKNQAGLSRASRSNEQASGYLSACGHAQAGSGSTYNHVPARIALHLKRQEPRSVERGCESYQSTSKQAGRRVRHRELGGRLRPIGAYAPVGVIKMVFLGFSCGFRRRPGL